MNHSTLCRNSVQERLAPPWFRDSVSSRFLAQRPFVRSQYFQGRPESCTLVKYKTTSQPTSNSKQATTDRHDKELPLEASSHASTSTLSPASFQSAMASSVPSSNDSYVDLSYGRSADVSNASTAPTSVCASPGVLNVKLAQYGLTDLMLPIIRDELVSIAEAAGKMMLDADPSIDMSDTKNNSSDRVTATDKAVENMIQSRLHKAYPQYSFLGEESFQDGDRLSDRPTWVIDPIDGTLNFIHGFPNNAVSLALIVEKKPVVGVVFNPFRGDMFTAVKDQGAYLTKANGTTHRLPLRSVPAPMGSLNDCLLAIEWGNQRQGPNWDLRTSVAMQLMSSKSNGGAMVHSIRSNGSAALDFCYVAAGSIDAFWEGGVWIWDVAAGWIILEEAGGIVASANPGDWDPTLEGRLYFGVRSAKRTEQEGIVQELWQLMGDRKFDF